MTNRKTKISPGWSIRGETCNRLVAGITRYNSMFAWAGPHNPVSPSGHDGTLSHRHVLLTAADLLAVRPYFNAEERALGHNYAPTLDTCLQCAAEYPAMLFGGWWFGPQRQDEGLSIDCLFIPLPDPGDAVATRVIQSSAPDEFGRPCGPDEDGEDALDDGSGIRRYRRLWWD